MSTTAPLLLFKLALWNICVLMKLAPQNSSCYVVMLKVAML
jgi:hypothetical protein